MPRSPLQSTGPETQRSSFPLPERFYLRDTVTVARDLLGKTLVRCVDGRRLSGRIVETEAYLGREDLASHAARGRPSGRAAPMYLRGGHAYVYLIYGMHHCFNVVADEADRPGAVLVRALEPHDDALGRTDGPGRLCQALRIDRGLNGVSLSSDALWIEAADDASLEIDSGPRVGVGYAGEWAARPWRFWVRDNRWVSGRAGARSPRRIDTRSG